MELIWPNSQKIQWNKKTIVNGNYMEKSISCLHSSPMKILWSIYGISPNILFFHNKIRDSKNSEIFFFQRTFIDHLLCICFWELGHSRTEQNPCSQETWDMRVSNTDKFHDFLELSFPFLSQLQFRWKQIIPNYTDNCLYTPLHGSCRLNHP